MSCNRRTTVRPVHMPTTRPSPVTNTEKTSVTYSGFRGLCPWGVCLKDIPLFSYLDHPGLPDQGINIRKQKSSIWDFGTPLPALLVNCQACTPRPLGLVHLENLSFPSGDFLLRTSHLWGAALTKATTSLAGLGRPLEPRALCFFVCMRLPFVWWGFWFCFQFCVQGCFMPCIVAIASSSTSDTPPGKTGTLVDLWLWIYHLEEWDPTVILFDQCTFLKVMRGGLNYYTILQLELFCHRNGKAGNTLHCICARHSGLTPMGELSHSKPPQSISGFICFLSIAEPICLEAFLWKF